MEENNQRSINRGGQIGKNIRRWIHTRDTHIERGGGYIRKEICTKENIHKEKQTS